MSTNKHIDKICIAVIAVMLVITVLFMCGEKLGITVIHREEDEETSDMFTANDLNADWDTADACNIVLKGDNAEISGNGAYFANDTLYISYAGKYLLSGTLDGSVHIDADGDDKIWLLFDGVEISSKTDAPLYIKQADKVFLTLKENTQNSLTFDNDDETSEIDGSIYSRDDLTINGKGNLTVTSGGLHGIVCNDSLVFTGGNIDITAKNDGVHAHDAIKICNTALTVSAGDDGLHAGNDDENSVFYFESGSIDIKKCYEGIEANDITIAGGNVNIIPSDDGINANGSGKTSLITISGGDITIINENGKDADGLDSNGNINIIGGSLFVSVVGSGTNNAIDYGSESGGKFTISGGTVVACGSSQMTESPDSESKQAFIMENVSGNAGDTLSLSDSNGKEIIEKEIPCSFTCALISSPNLSVGSTVNLKIGDTQTEITVNNVTKNNTGGFGEGRGNQKQFGGNGEKNLLELPNTSGEGGTFPQMPNGNNTPPEKPDGNGNDMPFGNRGGEGFKGETPPDMKEGSAPEPPQDFNPNGEIPNEDDEKSNRFGEKREFDKSENSESGKTSPAKTEDRQKTVNTVIYISLSLIVLIAGIFIAAKKKY